MSPASEHLILFVLVGAAGDLARRLVVPALFELRTGKRLAETVSEVSIRFRPVPHRAYPYTAAASSTSWQRRPPWLHRYGYAAGRWPRCWRERHTASYSTSIPGWSALPS